METPSSTNGRLVLTPESLSALIAKRTCELIGPVTITPELADHIMTKHNQRNRQLSKPHVGFLTREIETGNFRFTGNPIRFYPDGNLADGQHRLAACVVAKQPIDVAVLTMFEDLPLIDTGTKTRRPGDVLELGGVVNGTIVAPAIKIGAPWLENIRHGHNEPGPSRMSTREIREYYVMHQAPLDEAIAVAHTICALEDANPDEILSEEQIAAAYYVGTQVNEPSDMLRLYLTKLVTGRYADGEEDTPAIVASKLLEEDSTSTKGKRGYTPNARLAIVVEAYSMHKHGLRGKLRYSKKAKRGVFPGWPAVVAISAKAQEETQTASPAVADPDVSHIRTEPDYRVAQAKAAAKAAVAALDAVMSKA